MRKKSTLLFAVLVPFWLAGCSHSPTPANKVAQQQPAPQASAAQGTPAAVVTETEFDFGTVSEGNEYIHDFKIANKGDGPLQIINVFPA